MNLDQRPRPVILEYDNPDAPLLFTAEAMLSLARQRKGLSDGEVPEVCVLDPGRDLDKIRIPTKLGFKNPKWVTALYVTNQQPGGLWTDRGYNWFSGR